MAVDLTFLMRALKVTDPIRFVYWPSINTPDSAGAQAPVPAGELADIIDLGTYGGGVENFINRAFKFTLPQRHVYWITENAPDPIGVQAPVPASELTDFVALAVFVEPIAAYVEDFEQDGLWGQGLGTDVQDPGVPTHYWAFATADVSGAVVADRGSGGIDGGLQDGASVITTGLIRSVDGALFIPTSPGGDGLGPSLSVGASCDFDNEDFTVAGWVQIESGSVNRGRIIGNTTAAGGTGWAIDSTAGYEIRLESGANVIVFDAIWHPAYVGVGAALLVKAAAFFFIALTWETALGRARFYSSSFRADGPQIRNEVVDTNLIGASFANANATIAGSRATGNPDPNDWDQTLNNGRIDDLIVYRGTALTQGELAFLANTTLDGGLVV